MAYLLTFDMGTTSLKACLFDDKLNIIADTSKEYQLSTPAKDIVELDAEVYWDVVKESVAELLKHSNIDAGEVVSITCTTQGETLIPIDKDGNVLSPAIVWIDARAQEQSDFFIERIGHDEFFKTTGIPEIGPANPICKLKWYKDEKPDVYKNTDKFLLLEDFLIFKLTGQRVTNLPLIATTGYLNINTNELYDDVFEAAKLDKNKIPKILRSGTQVSSITEQAANELGISSKAVVTTAGIDQVCTAIGAGNINEGVVSEVTGTCLVVAATTEKPVYDMDKKMTYLKHYDDKFLILPYCTTAGIIFKWFKDTFCGEETAAAKQEGKSVYDVLTDMAITVPVGCEGMVLMPHFAGKLSPDTNAHATGVFSGVTLGSTKGHFVRAILEGVAFMLRENMEFIESFGIGIDQIRSVGGGANSDFWNQIKADVTGKQIIKMKHGEAASLGAAILGAVSCGFYDSVEEACEKLIDVNKSYQPNTDTQQQYDKHYDVFMTLYGSMLPVYEKSKQ